MVNWLPPWWAFIPNRSKRKVRKATRARTQAAAMREGARYRRAHGTSHLQRQTFADDLREMRDTIRKLKP